MSAISSYPADLTHAHFAVVEAISASARTLTLDPTRKYSLAHLGLKVDGSTPDSNTVYLARGADPTASFAEDDNKLILKDEWSVVVGPGVSDLRMQCAAGAPTIQVVSNNQIVRF